MIVGISILNNYLNKTINISHCSAIVFSEEIAKDGIGNIINSLASNDEIRPSAYVLISNKLAYDVLDKITGSGEKFSSRFYEYIISSADFTGYSGKTSFQEFSSKLNSNMEEASCIYTIVNEDTVQNAGLALFKGNTMIGTTSSLDSIIHLILSNNLKEALITIPNPFENNSFIDIEVKNNKNTKIDVSMINNAPFITTTMYLNANIKTSGKHFDYTNPENIKTVSFYAKKYLEKETYSYLYKLSKTYDTDVLEFQRILSKKCLNYDELDNYKFNEVFKDSFFHANINLQIESTNLFSKE